MRELQRVSVISGGKMENPTSHRRWVWLWCRQEPIAVPPGQTQTSGVTLVLHQIKSGGHRLHGPAASDSRGSLCVRGLGGGHPQTSFKAGNPGAATWFPPCHKFSPRAQPCSSGSSRFLQGCWKGSGITQNPPGAWDSPMGSSWVRKWIFVLVPAG